MRWSAIVIVVMVIVVAVAACSPSRPGEGTCTSGQLQCTDSDLAMCVDGSFVFDQTCPSVCDDHLGCVQCSPGAGVCLGTTSHVCNQDGMSYVDSDCSGPGVDCDPNNGLCEAPCTPITLAHGYLGCEYYPTVTGNEVSNDFSYALVIANYNQESVTATIDGAGISPMTFDIAGDSVSVQRLPWQTDLKLCNGTSDAACHAPTRFSARVNGGAYHLVTNRPVAVYQFNPLDYTNGDMSEFSYTNDASLLFPVNVWDTEYRVASWPEAGGVPGLLTVVGGQDNTTIVITPSSATQGDMTVASLTSGVGQTMTINAGDVVELGTVSGGDLTGSLVTSDKPVEVFGGHFCANVPIGTGYCDHLEESMIPVSALSSKYLVTPPRNDTIPNGRIEVIRIIATAPNTNLTFDPPQTNVNTTLQLAGSFVELASTDAAFMVTADQKILVAQYMIGQVATSGLSDPAMTVAVPLGQYRTQYLFNAPTNYTDNYVDVTAQPGTQLVLDGAPLTVSSTTIGSSGWSVTRVTLTNGPVGDGDHYITGSGQFGITVYGYGEYTAYWYPGGLDLAPMIQ